MRTKNFNSNSFAKYLGVSQTQIYNIADQNGRQSKPSFDLLTKILKTVDVDCRWLLLGETDHISSFDGFGTDDSPVYPTNDGKGKGKGKGKAITSLPPNVGQNDIIFSQEGGDGPKRDEKFTSDEKNKYYRANYTKNDILEEQNTVYQTNEDTMSTPDQNLQMIIELQRQLIAEKESHLQDMREMISRYDKLIERAFDESDDSDESGETSLGDIALAS